MKELWYKIQAIGLAVLLIMVNVAAVIGFVSTTKLHYAMEGTWFGNLYAIAAICYLVTTIAMTALNTNIFYSAFFKKETL